MINRREFFISPYEPCPLHPDKSFKFCCYKIAKENPMKSKIGPNFTDSRISHMIKSQWDSTDFKECLGFNSDECAGDIKLAHSIQNNRILDKISVDNHLYKFTPQISREGVKNKLEKISRYKASAFFGFCDIHDNKLFKPIEAEEYKNTDEQNFLFSFRSLALEYHKKIREYHNALNMFSEQPASMLEGQFVYNYRVTQQDKVDMEKEYNKFKDIYLSGVYSSQETVYLRLDYPVNFAVSARIVVTHDLFNRLIQDTYNFDEDLAAVTLNVYPTEKGSNIIISCFKEDISIFSELLFQLRSEGIEDIKKYLNRLIVDNTENFFVSEKLIDAMSEDERESLELSFDSSLFLDLNRNVELYQYDLFKQI